MTGKDFFFVPKEHEQRDLVVQEMKRERNVGDECFLVSLRWWRKWEKKVDFPSSSFPLVLSPGSRVDLFGNKKTRKQEEEPKNKFLAVPMMKKTASLSDQMESLDTLQLGQIDNSDLCVGGSSKKTVAEGSDNDSSTDEIDEHNEQNEKASFVLRKEGGEGEGGRLVVEKRKEILRRDLDEGVDFVVVSRGAWNLLHSWYGGGPCFTRFLVTQETPEKTLVVPEIHLCWLKVNLKIVDGRTDEKDVVTVAVSKKCSLSIILQFILKENEKKCQEKLPLLLSSDTLSLTLQHKEEGGEGGRGVSPEPFLLLKSEFGTQVRVFENIYESIESAKMANLELLSAVVVHVNEEGKDKGLEDKGKEREDSEEKGDKGKEKETEGYEDESSSEEKDKEKTKETKTKDKPKTSLDEDAQRISEEVIKKESTKKKDEEKKKGSVILRVLGGLGIVRGWGGDSGRARTNDKGSGKRDGRRESSPREGKEVKASRGYRVHIHNNAENEDWPVPPSMGSSNNSRPKGLGNGLRGMDNLGNTCYMNSAIQCLSHAPHLTDYFLSGEFTRDLNTNNPLGSGGKMAKSYANLLKHLWSPSSHSAFPPRDFRATVTKSFSQFQGHRQHDAQEFLAFMIDSLHEDVNKARNFKYEEYEDNTLPDDQAVQLTWERHKKRNQSIFVDRFQGMLKSEINCPVCENASVRFDPCMFLSVPVGGRTLQVKFVHYKLFYYPVKYGIIIEESETVGSILHKVEKAQDEPCKDMPEMKTVLAQNMVLCEVTDWTISSTLQKTEKIGPEHPRVDIYAFELPDIEFEKTTIVYLSTRAPDGTPFPFPLLLFSTAKTCQEFYIEVWEHIQWVVRQHTHIDKVDPKFGKALPPPPFELDFENLPFELRWIHEKCTRCRSTRRCSGHPLHLDKPLAFEAKRVSIKICWTEEGFDAVFHEKIAISVVVHTSGTKNSDKNRPMTLKKCLNRFSYRELLSVDNVWYCNKCRKHVQAWKKMDVWSASDYLIIHLKRFSFKERYRHKITRYVNFPLKGLDMSDICCVEKNKKKKEDEAKGKKKEGKENEEKKEGKSEEKDKSEENFYDLFAVINHHGGAAGGHYTTYVQPAGDEKWLHLNDSHVRQVNATQVVSQSAYVLMYRKRKLM